jgi:hypothetical protein
MRMYLSKLTFRYLLTLSLFFLYIYIYIYVCVCVELVYTSTLSNSFIAILIFVSQWSLCFLIYILRMRILRTKLHDTLYACMYKYIYMCAVQCSVVSVCTYICVCNSFHRFGFFFFLFSHET